MNATQPAPRRSTPDVAPATPSTKDQVIGPEEAGVLERILGVSRSTVQNNVRSAADILDSLGSN